MRDVPDHCRVGATRPRTGRAPETSGTSERPFDPCHFKPHPGSTGFVSRKLLRRSMRVECASLQATWRVRLQRFRQVSGMLREGVEIEELRGVGRCLRIAGDLQRSIGEATAGAVK